MSSRLHRILAAGLIVVLACAAAWAGAPAEKAAPAKAPPVKEGVSLTVYNQHFGVVRDVRSMDIKTGVLRFRDVATGIDPTSVRFKSLTDPDGTTIVEQNFEYDLINTFAALDRYLDENVSVTTKQGKVYRGRLLSFDEEQLIIGGDEGFFMIHRPDNVQSIDFGAVLNGLLTRPTLLWKIATDKPGKQLVEVTYQTEGMFWHADYSAVVNRDDTMMDLASWVTLVNQSGAAYKDARVKLVAGDVNREPMEVREAGVTHFGLTAPAVAEKQFFEYHMYTLPMATTVAKGEVKQVELLRAYRVPVTKRYVFEPSGRYWHQRYGDPNTFKANVYIEFRNSAESRLGMPLPKGKVRVYKNDPDDNAPEFIGENEIDHTPKDEPVRLYVGDAFDVVGSRTTVDHQIGAGTTMDSIRIDLANHKDQDIVVRIREHMGEGDWNIEKHEPEFKKIDSNTIEFDVPVKAGGTSAATYTVWHKSK